MRLFHLKVIRDIAKTNSISRAAEINEISQSAASQLLQQVEKQLNIELVDRTKRPLNLTAAGKLYASACRDILRRYSEIESHLNALRQELAGTVRVASIYSTGLYQMARIKEHFELKNQNTHIHLEYMRPEKVYQAVTEDQADLGLVSYPNPSKNLKTIPWRMERMVLVCHPSHRLTQKRSIKLTDLEGEEFVSFDSDLSIRKALDRFFRDQNVHRKVVLEFDNIEMIKEALVIGSGISILPERTVRHEAIQGRLVILPLEVSGLERPVGIVHLRSKKFSPAANRFLDFLRSTVSRV